MPIPFRNLGRWPALLPLLFGLVAAADAAPRVVVTIKPIHSLVAGVMAGVGEPELLIDGAQSPHDFTLRPSDARRLSEAQLVVWVGEGLETPLVRTLTALARGAELLELMELQGLELAPVRQGGSWEAHRHEEAGEHHEIHEGHGHHELDPHLWLSPANAGRIVTAVKETLSRLDPGHASNYGDNAHALLTRLRELDRDLERRTAPLRGVPYVVFHDAYQLFERRYRLDAVGSVTLSPERPPGARRIHELRARIASLGARCVFREPQFEPRLVQTLIEGSEARSGVLDPLGQGLPAGQEAYFTLLNRLADSLVSCLGD